MSLVATVTAKQDSSSHQTTADVSLRSTTTDVRQSHRDKSLTTKYRLNVNKSLIKKNIACNRDPYNVQLHTSNAVITLNTATFEYFSSQLRQHLKACGRYTVKEEPMYDTERRIVQDTLKIYHGGNDSSHLFTINMYRTKCRVLVNGPSYETFLKHDLNTIENQIDNVSETLDNVNKNMKKAIAECIKRRRLETTQEPPPNPNHHLQVTYKHNVVDQNIAENETPTEANKQDKQTKTTATRVSTGERKAYNTRSQLSKALPTPPADDNNEKIETASGVDAQKPPQSEEPSQSEESLRKCATQLVSEVIEHCYKELKRTQKKHTSPTEETIKANNVAATESQTAEKPATANTNEDPGKSMVSATTRPRRTTAKPPKYRDTEDIPKPKEKSPTTEPTAPDTTPGKTLYCTCRRPWNEAEGDNIVFCEKCKEWLHYACAGVDKEKVQQVKKFVCMQCSMKLLERNHVLEEEITIRIEDIKKLKASKDPTNLHNPPTTDKRSEAECDNLLKQIAETKEKYEKELDLRQTSLESLSTQNTKLQKEHTKQLQKIDTLNDKISSLESENEKLKQHNAAHIEFVRTSFQSDTGIIEQLEELNENNMNLKASISEKDKIISDLQNQMSPEGQKQKISSMKKEIDTLMARIRCFEDTVNGLQTTNTKLLEELRVESANYKRERELNDILMTKVSTPTKQPQVAVETTLDTNEITEEQEEERNTSRNGNGQNRERPKSEVNKRKERGPCCYEYLNPGSCKFKERCMFDHNIDKATLNDARLKDQMKTIQQSKAKQNNSRTRLCMNDFFQKDSCPFYQRRSGCKFSHEITDEMRKNPEIIETLHKIKQRKSRGAATTHTTRENHTNPTAVAKNSSYAPPLRPQALANKKNNTNPTYPVEPRNSNQVPPLLRPETSETNQIMDTQLNNQQNQTQNNPFLWDTRRTLQSQPNHQLQSVTQNSTIRPPILPVSTAQHYNTSTKPYRTNPPQPATMLHLPQQYNQATAPSYDAVTPAVPLLSTNQCDNVSQPYETYLPQTQTPPQQYNETISQKRNNPMMSIYYPTATMQYNHPFTQTVY